MGHDLFVTCLLDSKPLFCSMEVLKIHNKMLCFPFKVLRPATRVLVIPSRFAEKATYFLHHGGFKNKQQIVLFSFESIKAYNLGSGPSCS